MDPTVPNARSLVLDNDGHIQVVPFLEPNAPQERTENPLPSAHQIPPDAASPAGSPVRNTFPQSPLKEKKTDLDDSPNSVSRRSYAELTMRPDPESTRGVVMSTDDLIVGDGYTSSRSFNRSSLYGSVISMKDYGSSSSASEMGSATSLELTTFANPTSPEQLFSNHPTVSTVSEEIYAKSQPLHQPTNDVLRPRSETPQPRIIDDDPNHDGDIDDDQRPRIRTPVHSIRRIRTTTSTSDTPLDSETPILFHTPTRSRHNSAHAFSRPHTPTPTTAAAAAAIVAPMSLRPILDSFAGTHSSASPCQDELQNHIAQQNGHAPNTESIPPPATRIEPNRISLWEYFKAELVSAEPEAGNDMKKERVQNFFNVPFELEKLMFFGHLICLDSFLYIFTILPVRFLIAVWTLIQSIPKKTINLKSAQKVDLMKGTLFLFCCALLQYVDSSQLYHVVRGQPYIKLYVIFNSLEILDKLFSAFGHDILDSLFSKATPSFTLQTPGRASRQLTRFQHFTAATIYVYIHAVTLFFQCMTLTSAVNSYNNALLTLLLSNQFVEIKGSVFKKFEKENLFQLSCSDIVERFQLSVFLVIITATNLVQLIGGASFSLDTTLSYVQNLSASIFAPSLWLQPQWTAAFAAASVSPLPFFTNSSFATMMMNVTHTSASLHPPFFPSNGTIPATGLLFGNASTVSTNLTSAAYVTWVIQMLIALLVLCYLVIRTILLPLILALPHRFLRMVIQVLGSKEYKIIEGLVSPVVVVYGTEVLVDWLKHAFITKFNQIRPGVYARYKDSLCRDLVVGRHWWVGQDERGEEDEQHRLALVDQSPVVARRLGFVSLPLACLTLRVSIQLMQMLHLLPDDLSGTFWSSNPWKMETYVSIAVGTAWFVVAYLCLLLIKVGIGATLLNLASRRVAHLYSRHSVSGTNKPAAPKPATQLAPGQGAGNRNGNDLKLSVEVEEDTATAGGKEGQQQQHVQGRPSVVGAGGVVVIPGEEEKLDKIDRFMLVRSRVV